MRIAEPILRPVTETRDGALDSSYSLNWFRVYRVGLFVLVLCAVSMLPSLAMDGLGAVGVLRDRFREQGSASDRMGFSTR